MEGPINRSLRVLQYHNLIPQMRDHIMEIRISFQAVPFKLSSTFSICMLRDPFTKNAVL